MRKRIMLSVILSVAMAAAAFAAGAPEIEGEDAPDSVTLTGVYEVDETGDAIFAAGGTTYIVRVPRFAVDEEVLSPGDRVTVDGYTHAVTARDGREYNILHPMQVEIDGTTYVLPAPRMRLAAEGESFVAPADGEFGPRDGRLLREMMERRFGGRDDRIGPRGDWDDGRGPGLPQGRGGRR